MILVIDPLSRPTILEHNITIHLSRQPRLSCIGETSCGQVMAALGETQGGMDRARIGSYCVDKPSALCNEHRIAAHRCVR